MSTRPSTIRRAIPRVALEARVPAAARCAGRRSAGARQRRQVLDLPLEVVDRLVDAIDELEERVGCVVDRGVDDLADGHPRVDACGDAVDGGQLAVRPRLADRDDLVGRRDDVQLDVVGAVLAADGQRVHQNRQDAMPVALEERHRGSTVPGGRSEHLHCCRRRGRGDRLGDLVPARVDQIGPLRRHGHRG